MIGFLLKKTLYDTWDNLFRMVLLNLGFVASAAIPALVPASLSFAPIAAGVVMVLGVLWCFVYLSAAALVLKEIPDSGQFGFLDFAHALKSGWKTGIILGAGTLILGLAFFTAGKYYLTIRSFTGNIAVGLVFWFALISILALQFFLPVRARFEGTVRVVIKKCFLIFLDNLAFSLFCAFFVLIMLIISLFTAFLLPGPATAMSFLDQALRLRMLKYDYLKVNPDADRRKIPWAELISAEREQTGNRSFKNFIYPWKD